MYNHSVLFLLLILPVPLSATTFTFRAVDDYLFENPANWSPAYPGTCLQQEDKWIIETDMYISVPELLIAGMLEIRHDAKVVATQFSRTFNLHMLGSIDNAGQLIAADLYQAGTIFNRKGSRMHIRQYVAQPTAFTQNFGDFVSLTFFENQGRFDNYAFCLAEGNFRNLAVFNQIRNSRLEVAGVLFFSPGCILNQSQESEIVVGTVEKTPIHEHLATIFQ